jgi:hypothetical protein
VEVSKVTQNNKRRTNSQCSDAWTRTLDPNIATGAWTAAEETAFMLALEVQEGRRRTSWVEIATKVSAVLPGNERRTNDQCRKWFNDNVRTRPIKRARGVAKQDGGGRKKKPRAKTAPAKAPPRSPRAAPAATSPTLGERRYVRYDEEDGPAKLYCGEVVQPTDDASASVKFLSDEVTLIFDSSAYGDLRTQDWCDAQYRLGALEPERVGVWVEAKEGDTLKSIAQRQGVDVSVEELVELNSHLASITAVATLRENTPVFTSLSVTVAYVVVVKKKRSRSSGKGGKKKKKKGKKEKAKSR